MRNILSFLLGFTLTIAALGTLTLLWGCGSNNSSSNSTPTPGIGQWVDYGGPEPAISGNSFAFPCCGGNVVAGYFYTQLPVVPNAAQALVLNYTVTGNAPVFQQATQPSSNGGTDVNPPMLRLFLWRRGDDGSCTNGAGGSGGGNGGYADYRLFGNPRIPLVLGANQTIRVPFQAFTNCWGVLPANLQDTLNNLMGAGFAFGGQSFSHGIYLSSGIATFTINSFTVQ